MVRSPWRTLACAGTILMAAACSGSVQFSPTSPRVLVVETPPLGIDRIYHSMEGPYERVPVDASKIGWITALRSEVIDAETDEPMNEEFFCHSQLQLPDGFRPIVMATGISEVRFPPGFGMPMATIMRDLPDDPMALSFLGMVLNNNVPKIDRRARIRATIEYLTEEDVGSPPSLKKLYRVGLPMTVEDLEEYHPEIENTDVTTHCVLVDGQINHWMVPPGRQKTRKTYPHFIPFDSTAHYAVVHLHNYGVYMRLTDLTTGEIVWQADVINEPGRNQIAEIPVYSSVKGFPLYKDHVYEIEALYDNTSDEDISAMAMMSLYHHPTPEQIRAAGGRVPE